MEPPSDKVPVPSPSSVSVIYGDYPSTVIDTDSG
jgi:hypothetical protein